MEEQRIVIVDQAAHDYDMTYFDVKKIWLANEDSLEEFYQGLEEFIMNRADDQSAREEEAHGQLAHLDVPTHNIPVCWAHPQNTDKIKLWLIRVVEDKYLCIDVTSDEGIVPEDSMIGRLVTIPELHVENSEENDYDITTCPIYTDFLFQYFIASMKTEQVELSCNVYRENE